MPVTHGQGNPHWSRDETILALDLVHRKSPRIPGKQSREVKALSDLLRRLPIHVHAKKNEKFRNPDGVYLKLQNLASLDPANAGRKGLHYSRTDREVWEWLGQDPAGTRLLADQIVKGTKVIESPDEPTDVEDEEEDTFEALEGRVLTRVHRRRERCRGFRKRVIRRVQKAHGMAMCEGCDAAIRGPVGLCAYEVHHLVPIARAAESPTRLPDLALLCANCHRLIHAVMRHERRHYGLDDFRDWHTALTTAPAGD